MSKELFYINFLNLDICTGICTDGLLIHPPNIFKALIIYYLEHKIKICTGSRKDRSKSIYLNTNLQDINLNKACNYLKIDNKYLAPEALTFDNEENANEIVLFMAYMGLYLPNKMWMSAEFEDGCLFRKIKTKNLLMDFK